MDNLDKFFKDKLDRRDFAWSDDYWLEAERAIAAREGARRRRRFGWTLLGSLLLVSAAASLWMWKTSAAEPTGLGAFPVNLQKASFQEESSQQPATPLSVVSGEWKEPDSEASLSSSEASRQAEAKASSAKSEQVKPAPDESAAGQQVHPPLPGATSSEQPSPEPEVAELPGSRDPIPEGEHATAEEQDKDLPVELLSELPEESEPGSLTARTDLLFPAILPFRIEQPDRSSPDLPGTLFSFEERVDRPSAGKFHLGMRASALIYPGPGTDASLFAGYSFGPVGEYRWRTGWWIELAPAYQQRRINLQSDSLAFAAQRTFGFGLDDDRYVLEVRSMHSATVQLGLGKLIGRRSGLEAGMIVGRLLGLRGDLLLQDHLYPWQRNAGQELVYARQLEDYYSDPDNSEFPVFREETSVDSGWLPLDGFRKWQFDPYLGFRQIIGTNLALSGQMTYRLLPLTTGTEEQGEAWPLSLRISATYFIR